MEFKEKRPLYILDEPARILRSENGCQWDKEQTSMSLRPYLIEEAYELYDAIESGDPHDIKEELGDLLYQVFAHAQIAREEEKFTIDEVSEGIVKKLVGRHPHVFGDEEANSADEVIARWEILKKKEKAHRESILDGVPRHLPSLLKAYRVQQKVSRVGFDWEKVGDAVKKLDEELGELKEAIEEKNQEKIVEESGDILFSIVNVLRFMKVNPDEALNRSVSKFINRFMRIEKEVKESGRSLEKMTLEELDVLWDEAKEC
jgi:tetrapyrrole methylase family protein/MazG family protein